MTRCATDIRVLHYNLKVAKAWHKAVLANSPFAYKTFHDNYSNSLYAPAALKLQVAPKAVPLMQFTHLAKQSPIVQARQLRHPRSPHQQGAAAAAGPFQHMPGQRRIEAVRQRQHGQDGRPTCPASNGHSPFNAGNRGGNAGKFSRMPGRFNNNPMQRRQQAHVQQRATSFRRPDMGGGSFSQRFVLGPVAHVVRPRLVRRRPRRFGRMAASGGGSDRALRNNAKPGRAAALPGLRLRRDDQATSLANRSASTLPPESTMTTFLPLASMRPASSAARPTAPPGSTTSFNSR